MWEANQRFLQQHEDTVIGINACESLERFLKRLNVIDDDIKIIEIDWSDHMDWQYRAYKERVGAAQLIKKIKTALESKAVLETTDQ